MGVQALYLQLTYFALTIAGLLIATHTDLKERIVPNKLTYSLIGTGLALKAIESVLAGTTEPIVLSIAGGLVGFAAGYALYRLGAWAGGDVKLVTAVAVLNPINYNALGGFFGLDQQLFSTTNLPVFGVTLIIYSALAVFPIGLVATLTTVFRHKEVLEKTKKALAENTAKLVGAAVMYEGANKLLQKSFSQTDFVVQYRALFLVLLLVVLAMQKEKTKKIIVALLGLAGLLLGGIEFVVSAASIAMPFLVIYGLWKLYSESKAYAFKETVKVDELEEGIVPDSLIVERKGKVQLLEAPSAINVIKKLIGNKIESALREMKVEGRVITDPRQAGGLTKEQAGELKQLARKGKIPRIIVVRKTMAFVPAILLAYIVLQISGDVIWKIVLG